MMCGLRKKQDIMCVSWYRCFATVVVFMLKLLYLVFFTKYKSNEQLHLLSRDKWSWGWSHQMPQPNVALIFCTNNADILSLSRIKRRRGEKKNRTNAVMVEVYPGVYLWVNLGDHGNLNNLLHPWRKTLLWFPVG